MDKIFWLENPKILINNYLNFIPNNKMNETELFNSISLLLIYSIILIIIFGKIKYIWPIIILLILIIIFYSIKNIETFTNTPEQKPSIQSELTYNNSLNNPDQPIYPTDIKTEIGYYNFDDKLYFNRIHSKPIKTTPEINKELTFECRKPTTNNPFMNPDITDYNTPKNVAACNDDTPVENVINKSFNSSIFKNIEDAISGENSIRQFYTVPNTAIPNHQTEFSQWLYKAPTTCKEDQSKCLRQEDLRYSRSIFV